MKLKICSGYPLSTRKGNSVTAMRLEGLLREHGVDATAVHCQRVGQANAVIALNAVKCADLVLNFARDFPGRPVHVILTGTDLYQSGNQHEDVLTKVLDAASSLVVAHPECMRLVGKKWHPKMHVIYPSVELPEVLGEESFGEPSFTCLGHLREVKNSHQMFRALQLIKGRKCEAYLLGDALEQNEARIALKNESLDPRYRWISGLSRERALAYMKGSIATINSSYLEGGANAVAEAIVLGIPVLASRIDGNVGLLGSNYAGFFEVQNDGQLAQLMQNCLDDCHFRSQLKQQLAERLELFSTASEAQAWIALLREFNPNRDEFSLE